MKSSEGKSTPQDKNMMFKFREKRVQDSKSWRTGRTRPEEAVKPEDPCAWQTWASLKDTPVHSRTLYGERFHKVVSSSRSGMVAYLYVSLVLSLAFLHVTDMQKIFLGTGEQS